MFYKSRPFRLICFVLVMAMFLNCGPVTFWSVSQRLPAAPSEVNLAEDAQDEGAEIRFDGLLTELQALLEEAEMQLQADPETGFEQMARLIELRSSLEQENEKVLAYFGNLEALIKQKGLSAETQGVSRHEAFVRDYQSKYERLMANLDTISAAEQPTTGLWGWLTGANQPVELEPILGETLAFLSENSPQLRESHFDPNNLPHRSLRAEEPIPPKLTVAEWEAAFAQEIDTNKGNSARLAPLSAPTGPTPEDLGETIEVQFTSDITQLAADLDHNPVQIFNWVRNNIEFVPTWGSIQGAQLCLETRTCNAFDTSSLLIALLRVSEIPARYQMGTIEVPIEEFMNWAGGFSDPDAAASLLASGGVPSVVRRVDNSGEVVSVKLEHVWVKAFVDYIPSGGAVHVEGDTWLEMDGSFKQYEFTEPLDWDSAVPNNLPETLQQLLDEATVDPSTGSLTDLDSTALAQELRQVRDEHHAYLQTTLPNATFGEVAGKRVVSDTPLPTLAATLPYNILQRGILLAEIPDELRHTATFTLRLASSPSSPALLNVTQPLAALGGRDIALSYTAASQADQELILAALEKHEPWSSIVQVTAALVSDGETLAGSIPLGLGTPVEFSIDFTSPTINTPSIINTLLAGEMTAIGLNLQGIAASQIERLSQRSTEVVAQLNANSFEGLVPWDFTRLTLMPSILSWFAAVDTYSHLTSRQADVAFVRYPSLGLFFIKLETNSLFGQPSLVTPVGFTMDVDRDMVVLVPKDGDSSDLADLVFLQGAYGSAMEAEGPVQVLSREDYPLRGLSTAHILRLANDQGIPIHEITSANAGSVLPQLELSAGELTDIQNALNAEYEVIVPAEPVIVDGEPYVGMVIRDPLTGSASFLIGGANGGEMTPEEKAQYIQDILVLGGIISFIGVAVGFLWALAFPIVGIFVQVFFISMLITFLTLLALGPDTALLNLSGCVLAFLEAGGIIGVIGFFAHGAYMLLAGVVLGLIGIEVCES